MKIEMSRSISRRIVLYIVLFSSVLTLLATIVQLSFEYNREIGGLNSNLDKVSDNFIGSVREAVWSRDITQLAAIAQGIQAFDDIEAIVIEDESGILVNIGSRPKQRILNRKFILTYPFRGNEIKIGSLMVYATTQNIYTHLFDQFLIILFSNALKTFLVALFALAIFDRLVTGRLHKLAETITQSVQRSSFDVQNKVIKVSDEIELVAAAFDQQQAVLRDSENQLAEQEQRISLIADSIPAMIFYIDQNRVVQYANQTALSWHQMAIDEIINQQVSILLPAGEARDIALPKLTEALLGARQDFDFRHDYADGVTRAVQATIEPHRDEVGIVLGVVVLMVDMSEREVLELQLRQSQKMESVGQLTGGVAHDFNNLLAVILGSAELLQESSEGESDEDITAIIRAAERGGSLTSKLLAFSRKQNLDPKPLKLDEAMGGFVELLRRTLSADIDIETVSAAGLWACSVDSLQLENAILNLALNARDAMPKGGKLTLETRNVTIDDDYAAGQIELWPGRYVLLAITDTGIGIEKNALPKVLEPFYTTKELDRGTGLGLSMVYGFAKQSGGHLTIYSEVGRGTTVKVYFPVSEVENVVVDNSPKQTIEHGNNKKILVIEDETDVRILVSKMVEEFGFQVIQAETGIEALAIVQDDDVKIDLILSDVMLPGGMLGPEFVKLACASNPELKVVYMTGYAENAIVHNGHLNRDVFVLQKPFRKIELGLKLMQALRGEE